MKAIIIIECEDENIVRSLADKCEKIAEEFPPDLDLELTYMEAKY